MQGLTKCKDKMFVESNKEKILGNLFHMSNYCEIGQPKPFDCGRNKQISANIYKTGTGFITKACR